MLRTLHKFLLCQAYTVHMQYRNGQNKPVFWKSILSGKGYHHQVSLETGRAHVNGPNALAEFSPSSQSHPLILSTCLSADQLVQVVVRGAIIKVLFLCVRSWSHSCSRLWYRKGPAATFCCSCIKALHYLKGTT